MTVNPSPTHLEVKINGDSKQLFMSYALLSRCTLIVGGPDQVPLLASDVEIQEKVLLEVLTVREKKNIVFKPETLDEIEVSLEDISLILDWVGSHIVDFFMKQTVKAVDQAKRYQKQVESLQHTANGLVPSPSSNAAA